MSIPNFLTVSPPRHILSATISSFSKSVNLFLLCKFVCDFFLDYTCKDYHTIFLKSHMLF